MQINDAIDTINDVSTAIVSVENRQQPQSSSPSSSLKVPTTGLKKPLSVFVGTVTAYSICAMVIFQSFLIRSGIRTTTTRYRDHGEMEGIWDDGTNSFVEDILFLPFILMFSYVSVVGVGNLERFVNISSWIVVIPGRTMDDHFVIDPPRKEHMWK
uniref:Uncharacterized protein n=1 Tax=Tanacetum cinerariifolium TaxID=118510 RepID=A0A699IXU5_TANCI|nr:hypothetical protein [Tanacetum cinerariifolium]